MLRRMNLYGPVGRLLRYLDSLELRQIILYGAREVQQAFILETAVRGDVKQAEGWAEGI
jgi:hypothetical protein